MLASLLIKTVIWLAFMAALLFVPAGTIAWPQAWVFLIEMVATGVLITGWLYVHDPALLGAADGFAGAARNSLLTHCSPLRASMRPWPCGIKSCGMTGFLAPHVTGRLVVD